MVIAKLRIHFTSIYIFPELTTKYKLNFSYLFILLIYVILLLTLYYLFPYKNVLSTSSCNYNAVINQFTIDKRYYHMKNIELIYESHLFIAFIRVCLFWVLIINNGIAGNINGLDDCLIVCDVKEVK